MPRVLPVSDEFIQNLMILETMPNRTILGFCLRRVSFCLFRESVLSSLVKGAHVTRGTPGPWTYIIDGDERFLFPLSLVKDPRRLLCSSLGRVQESCAVIGDVMGMCVCPIGHCQLPVRCWGHLFATLPYTGVYRLTWRWSIILKNNEENEKKMKKLHGSRTSSARVRFKSILWNTKTKK